MPLALWHGGFFKRIVRCTKMLLKKTLETAKLTYEELQTVLYVVEQIINNRPITYYYSDNEESCLTPNHLLHRRTLNYSNLLSDSTAGEVILQRNLTLLGMIKERIPRKFMKVINQRQQKTNTQQFRTVNVVVTEEGNMLKSRWRLGKVEGIFK